MIQYFKKINNTASLYDYFDYENNPYQNFRTKIIIDEISDIVHSYSGVVRILDIGCANGFIISKLCSSLGEKIECTGIDFLEENIAEAKILSNQTFICNDLSGPLPINFEEYDVILLSDFLYYLDENLKVKLLYKLSNKCLSRTNILLCTRFSKSSSIYDSYYDLVYTYFNYENFNLINALFWSTNLLSFNSRLYSYLLLKFRFFYFFKFLFKISHRFCVFLTRLSISKTRKFYSTNLYHHFKVS